MIFFVLEDSFCTFFNMVLINGVRLADSTIIWNQFIEKFCNNLSHQLQLKTNILKTLINLYLNYGLYLPAEILKNVEKILQIYGFPIL